MDNNSGYLGGDVSMAERFRLRDKHLAPIAANGNAVDKGWRCQCRCGSTTYVYWRRRWYCVVCARWVREFPATNNESEPEEDRCNRCGEIECEGHEDPPCPRHGGHNCDC